MAQPRPLGWPGVGARPTRHLRSFGTAFAMTALAAAVLALPQALSGAPAIAVHRGAPAPASGPSGPCAIGASCPTTAQAPAPSAPTVHGAAAPTSTCESGTPQPPPVFTCNLFESDGAGNPSEISQTTLPATVGSGFVIILERPGGSMTDPTQWSDILNFENNQTPISGNIAQFVSQNCSCFASVAAAALAGTHVFLTETQTGIGSDTSDSTPFSSSGHPLINNQYNLFSAAPIPDMTVVKSHAGSFVRGQVGATYTLTISNIGGAPTTAPVTVTDTLPSGLSATAIGGTGWSCTLANLTCTRSDVLSDDPDGASSYPPITVTVNVDPNAPPSVTNVAMVSGGGEVNTSNDTASDPTTIVAPRFTG